MSTSNRKILMHSFVVIAAILMLGVLIKIGTLEFVVLSASFPSVFL